MGVARYRQYHHTPGSHDGERSVVRAERVSAVKIEHSYQLFRDGQLLATASSVLACVDRAGFQAKWERLVLSPRQ